jgi:hypothetical protein
VFADLDATLRAVLDDPAAPADLRTADVSFETPEKGYAPTQPTVNLFLHDVSENRGLRDNAPFRELIDGVYTVTPPPLRVDCSYLCTAWSAQSGGFKAQEEHRLLGQALLWMSRFALVEDRFMQGGLRTPAQPYPIPLSVGQTREGQSMGQFWSALGTAPRPAFSVTLTVTLQPDNRTESFPATESFVVGVLRPDHPALAGRVLDHTLRPVPAAQVAVSGTALHTTVGASGAFRFSGLDFGGHTLVVQPPGQPSVNVGVQYAEHAQTHNVILPEP